MARQVTRQRRALGFPRAGVQGPTIGHCHKQMDPRPKDRVKGLANTAGDRCFALKLAPAFLVQPVQRDGLVNNLPAESQPVGAS